MSDSPVIDVPRPAVTPPQPYTFPLAQRRTLSNGLEVVAYDVPGQYVHSVRVALPLPLTREPREIEGVATIMARALDEGTSRYSSAQFAQLLERRGVAIGTSISEAGLTVDVDVAKRHLAYALDLLRQVITEPAFPDHEIDRHRKTRLAEIEQERATPGQRGALELIATYYADTERASRPTAGSRETVRAVTRDDVVAYHAANVSPRGGTVVIAGDLEGVDPIAEIEAALGAWTVEGADVADATGPVLTSEDRGRIVVIDRPGAVQTELAIACPGPDRSVAGGWSPYPVLGFIVGGSPNARVDAVLREEKGYTYGIRSVFRPRRRGGMFLTSGSVRADSTVESLGLLLDLLESGRDGFTAEEVRAGVDFVSLTAPGRYATADAIADEAAALSLEGLTTAFTTANLQDMVTLEGDRLQAAYREFVDGQWTVVVVGDA
ncbi:MAG: pitrilysin family protein, partial [Lapillicoccus sp.]